MFTGRLLVVMPNGFGIYHARNSVATEQAALARTPVHNGENMAEAAAAGVRQLAAAAGEPLSQTAAPAPTVAATGSGLGTISWAVLMAGAALVLAAWAASLRARPLGRRSAVGRGG